MDVKRVLVEGEFVSASEYEKLKQLNPELEFVMVEELVERVRNIKDDLEIAALRKASLALKNVQLVLNWTTYLKLMAAMALISIQL